MWAASPAGARSYDLPVFRPTSTHRIHVVDLTGLLQRREGFFCVGCQSNTTLFLADVKLAALFTNTIFQNRIIVFLSGFGIHIKEGIQHTFFEMSISRHGFVHQDWFLNKSDTIISHLHRVLNDHNL